MTVIISLMSLFCFLQGIVLTYKCSGWVGFLYVMGAAYVITFLEKRIRNEL